MLNLNCIDDLIVQSVRNFYEHYPYPNYPLWFKPKWQDGYLGASKFCDKLLYNIHNICSPIKNITNNKIFLSIGCGEILPYIIRKIEPKEHIVICVDLSRISLNRARFRLLFNTLPIKFISQDINDFLINNTYKYSHVDAYGVLHHLANPQHTLSLLQNHLYKNSTMRVMIYNAYSRRWIRHFQKIFNHLKINPYDKKEYSYIKQLFNLVSNVSPILATRLKRIAYLSENDYTILADTFLHPREINFSFTKWMSIFKNAGFNIFSMLDRYGELDDLPNPLWKFPCINVLNNKINTGRFEANFELFMWQSKGEDVESNLITGENQNITYYINRFRYIFKRPPHLWFSFAETQQLSKWLRFKIWKYFIDYVFFNKKYYMDNICVKELGINASKRLARLGAIFPDQLYSNQLRATLEEPINESIEFDANTTRIDFFKTNICNYLEQYLKDKKLYSRKKLDIILHRLNNAQD